jgi:hypothetical protein
LITVAPSISCDVFIYFSLIVFGGPFGIYSHLLSLRGRPTVKSQYHPRWQPIYVLDKYMLHVRVHVHAAVHATWQGCIYCRAACPFCMFMSHVHTAFPCSCCMSMSMVYVHVHAAWTWTCSMDIDMQHGHERAATWTVALT